MDMTSIWESWLGNVASGPVGVLNSAVLNLRIELSDWQYPVTRFIFSGCVSSRFQSYYGRKVQDFLPCPRDNEEQTDSPWFTSSATETQ